jgi:hypothetical protein
MPTKDYSTCRLTPGLHSFRKRKVTNIRIII